MNNSLSVTVFTLSGLNHIQHKGVLFFLTLLVYLLILFGNVSLVVIIIMDRSLHEPMFIFLCNLFICALYGTAGFYPKFLSDLLSASHVISYAGCLIQGYVIHSAACCDLSILALMAYDRYVAICRPLVYHAVMTRTRIFLLVFFAWLIPLFAMFMNTASILNSQLCGSHINKLYCVNYYVTRIACSRSKFHTGISYFNILFYFGHFLFIFWSYLHLVRTCQTSKENREKFLQTCLPHLVSLVIFAFTLLLDILYMRLGPRDISQHLKNFMAIEFLIISPILNPLIYGFKLTKIRMRILRIVRAKK